MSKAKPNPWYVKLLAIPALLFAMISSAVILAFCRIMMRGNKTARREAAPVPIPRRTTTPRSSPSNTSTTEADDNTLTNLAVAAVSISILSDTGNSNYSPSDSSSGVSGGGSIDSSSF